MLSQASLLILIISDILTALIAIVAYRKNPNSATNKLFSLLCVALIGWTAASYFANSDVGVTLSQTNIIFIKIAFVLTSLQNLFFLLLIKTFPDSSLRISKFWMFLVIMFVLIAGALPFSGPFFISHNDGMTVPGPGMMVIMLSILVFTITGLTMLVRKLHRLSGIAKNQARFLILAAVIIWALIPLSVGILPILFNLGIAYTLSPLIALLFSLTIAYAVIRQRLFDIRPIAARSLSYSLFLIALVVAYVVVAFGVSSLFGKK